MEAKMFRITVTKPFVYNLPAPPSLDDKEIYDIAWTKFREAFVISESSEEASAKIRATLPPENPEIKSVLLRIGVKSEYYTIEAKELEGKDGVYYC